jgi:hypothetical protein
MAAKMRISFRDCSFESTKNCEVEPFASYWTIMTLNGLNLGILFLERPDPESAPNTLVVACAERREQFQQ